MWYQLLLCLFIMLLLWYVKDDKKRTKYILPLGFIIITIFFKCRFTTYNFIKKINYFCISALTNQIYYYFNGDYHHWI